MGLRTPHRGKPERRVFAPAKVEGDDNYHLAKSSNVLRSISGQLFKKTSSPSVGVCREGRFQPLGVLTPESMERKAFKRNMAPRPLNLAKIISPPKSNSKRSAGSDATTTISSTDSFPSQESATSAIAYPHVGTKRRKANTTTSVDSAVRMIQPRNLRAALLEESLKNVVMSPRTSIPRAEDSNATLIKKRHVSADNNKSGLIPTYYSPTVGREPYNNLLRMNRSPDPRKLVGEVCSLCEEKVLENFAGEKAVELSCSHVSHYQCYLTVLSSLQSKGGLPQCGICKKGAVPREHGVFLEMNSAILSGGGCKTGVDIGEQWIDLGLSQYPMAPLDQTTPQDQLIRSSDVTPNGFVTPVKELILSARDEKLYDGNIFGGDSNGDGHGFTDCFNEKKDETEVPCQSNKNYEFVFDLTDEDDEMNEASDCFSEIPGEEDEVEVDGEVLRKAAELEGELSSWVKKFLGLPDTEEFGRLLLFENVVVSTDGDEWSASTRMYQFEKAIILYDYLNEKINGRVPVDQISFITELSDNCLLLNLNSTALPEVYLQFPVANDCEELNSPSGKEFSAKVRYGIENVAGSCLAKSGLQLSPRARVAQTAQITQTALASLPAKLQWALVELASAFGSDSSRSWWSWRGVNNNTPLRLVLCVNLSTFGKTRGKKESHGDLIVHTVEHVLCELAEEDLFGLVLVGKSGSGEVGGYGTYVGAIGKSWEGWKDVVQDIAPVNEDAIQGRDSELLLMLQTCAKLASTLDLHSSENKCGGHHKNLVLLLRECVDDSTSVEEEGTSVCTATSDNGSAKAAAISKWRKKLEGDYGFVIEELFLSNSKEATDSAVRDLINRYRK